MIGGRGGLAYLVRPDDVISGQPLMEGSGKGLDLGSISIIDDLDLIGI